MLHGLICSGLVKIGLTFTQAECSPRLYTAFFDVVWFLKCRQTFFLFSYLDALEIYPCKMQGGSTCHIWPSVSKCHVTWCISTSSSYLFSWPFITFFFWMNPPIERRFLGSDVFYSQWKLCIAIVWPANTEDKRKTVVYQDAAVPCYITFYTKECTLPRSWHWNSALFSPFKYQHQYYQLCDKMLSHM